MKEKFCEISDKIKLYEKFNLLDKKCNSCNSLHHYIFNCPLINYIPNKEKILMKFKQKNVQKKRILILRKKKRKKINSLKLKQQIQNIFEDFMKFNQKEFTKFQEYGIKQNNKSIKI